jgi:hypothetical protein
LISAGKVFAVIFDTIPEDDHIKAGTRQVPPSAALFDSFNTLIGEAAHGPLTSL